MAIKKRVQDLYAAFDREKAYPLEEALEIVKKSATAKFDETVEVHLRLGIDPKKGDQQIRSTVSLPHGFGEAKKVAVFVPNEKEKEAKEAGADFVYSEQDIDKLKKTGKIEFDIAVAVPDIMKSLSPLARILGPKGLMPSPKNETITTNLKKTIGELKKGKIAFKNDDSSNVHQAIGKVSTDDKALLANYNAFLDALKKTKPESTKGIFVRAITLCSSMGPGVKVQM
ncbi:50S ribosomal protein L1 [Candidatus Kuenenbacteria bacterium]|nr:50S ribosomal protein L1 [Candidatus Kuenenbacteria bacterium]